MATKQKQQQKRLSANVKAAKSNRADAKKPATRSSTSAKPPASKAGGFLERIFGGKPPKTTQESIPYREMYRDGICRVTSDLYSKTVTFGDINYHLAQPDDKTAIFENYSDFLNYYDSSVTSRL
ncbi:hypothetical protein FACS1894202_14180 [Clostridia bacterium]|nr:hypothetical protein FACS1894202_14180 [Clostridia bacterium]